MNITERFKPTSLDFGFAYGDRSFSCKAVVISFSKSHIKLSLTDDFPCINKDLHTVEPQ